MSDSRRGGRAPEPGPTVVEAPLAGARRGELVFERGASLLSVAGAADLGALFRATFEGPAPRVTAAGGAVRISYRRPSPLQWATSALLWGRRASSVTLSAALPWRVAVRGGASRLRLDLRALRVTGLQIDGGASQVEVDLPRPGGRVLVRVDGGASHVTLRRPAGVAVRLSVAAGATRLTIDGQHYGAVAGDSLLATAGAGPGELYEVSVGGGASELTVEELPG